MLLAVVLAWPEPVGVLLVCAVNVGVLGAVAFRRRLPLAHLPALACLALEYLTATHLLVGPGAGAEGAGLGATILSARGGVALVALVALLAAAAEVLARLGRTLDAVWYAAGAGVVAVASLALVTLLGVDNPAACALVCGSYAAIALATNLRWRRPELTWAASALLLAGLVYALVPYPGTPLPRPWLLALLGHATLVLAASLGVRARAGQRWHRPYAEPLGLSALCSSLASVPLLCWIVPGEMTALTLYAAWLAAVWLVLAWTRRWPLLYWGFQAVLTAAVVYAVTAWLQHQPWAPGDPRGLQAYGLGIVGLGLLSIAARFVLRDHPVARDLAESPGAAGYRLALGAVVVVGQLSLAVWGVLPGVLRELTPVGVAPAVEAWPAVYWAAYGPGAWVLLAALAVVLVAALAPPPPARWPIPILLGLVLLALTVPVLAAGPMDQTTASASALRWGLAAAFLLLSSVVWARGRLMPLAACLGLAGETTPPLPVLVRVLLLGGAAVPVLVLTLVVAAVGFQGTRTTGPAADSFFGQMGWTLSNIVPLAVLSLGLVGHAVRERSPGYAFGAGLLANVCLTGGYALQVVAGGGRLDAAQVVLLLQLATCVAAAWAIAWSAAGTRLARLDAGPLLGIQVGMAVAGTAMLLAVGLWGLLLVPRSLLGETLAAWVPGTGTVAGWAAFVLTGAATVQRCLRQDARQLPHVVGMLGLAAVGLLGCSVERWAPGAGYRTVLLGWAGYALAWSLAGWKREAPAWVGTAAVLAALLAVKAALVQADQLGAAAALAMVGAAAGVQGVRDRREEWTFAAGLAVELAATFVVWHVQREVPLSQWLVLLLQVNVLVSAAVALAWLGLRRHLYEKAVSNVAAAPLLAAQVLLGLAGNVPLLGGPLLSLFAAPGEPLPPELLPAGTLWGWLPLVLALAAACWYAVEAAPHVIVPLLVALGVGGGVLAACSVNPWDRGTWLSARVLLVAWLLTAVATLTAGAGLPFRARRAPGSVESDSSHLQRNWDLVPAWVSVVGLLVLALAVRGAWEDPARPFWSAGALLVLAAAAGVVAVVWRQPLFSYVAGLLVNGAGAIAWVAWGKPTAVSFAYAQVLCLGLASAAWSLAERVGRVSVPAPVLRGRALPFAPVAAVLALAVLAVPVLAGLASDLTWSGRSTSGPLAWMALAAAVLAVILVGGAARSRLVPPGLYAAGLLGIGLGLHAPELPPAQLLRMAAPVLAAYVWLAGYGYEPVRRFAGLPAGGAGRQDAWFFPAQAAVAAVVLPLSVWTTLAFDILEMRLGGVLAAALLLGAGVFLAELAAGRWRRAFCYGSLALAPLVLAEAGWAALGTGPASPWLHRSVLALLAVALMTWFEGVALVRLLRRQPDWAECARRIGPVLGGVAAVLLLADLAQEALLYDTALKFTPMAGWAVAVVAGGFLALIAAAITFAVVPARDPLGLSERGRMLYVYAAEAMLVLLFVHAKLTVPGLFGPWGAKYWTFIVMGIAFVGVGLSEWFKRRQLPVLAEPLQWTGIFLPLLPLFAFWVRPPAALVAFAQEQVPGLAPLVAYLNGLPQHFGQHAVLWFALGALYAAVALGQRSFRFALLAALAGNFGLWALLVHYDLSALVHPQLWLIPLALIGLIAEHLNRDRLGPAQAAALRYLALCVLYLSSTADMFIAGLGNSVVLPLVLAVLSVLGVLGGILARVRAFLFLGVTFLGLVIFSMIWHAAVDLYQTWLWWVSGIILGAVILTLFAVFEKRRQDVVQLLEHLQKWQ
jgi:hypothetical protein